MSASTQVNQKRTQVLAAAVAVGGVTLLSCLTPVVAIVALLSPNITHPLVATLISAAIVITAARHVLMRRFGALAWAIASASLFTAGLWIESEPELLVAGILSLMIAWIWPLLGRWRKIFDRSSSTVKRWSALACDFDSTEESRRRGDLLQKLRAQLCEFEELPDGLRFQLKPDPDVLAMIVRFVDLERRCCPAFKFEIACDPERGPIWLTVRAPNAENDRLLKEFLRQELTPLARPGQPGVSVASREALSMDV